MQDNLIIGVMGHIDHGKTSLIRALNGFWGDERSDERERGITLDLSFSNLSNGEKNIAFIDVPGHEKLVKNMIAGAFGLDYAMLVVSANEGIMPQTLEHLKISSLLGIHNFLVVLSKIDLVDKKRIQELKQEIKQCFAGFESLKYQIFEVSIYDSASMKNLKNSLFMLPKSVHRDLGFFRYYIDRIFVIKGSGCVVSGTLLDGSITLEDKVWCCNLERLLGIKNIQCHGESVPWAKSGQRVALNLSGVSHNELKRGDLLTKKGYLRGFDRVEVALHLFEEIPHNLEAMFFIGALKMSCRILFLEDTKKYATLKFKSPIYSIFDERFILRDDNHTLGGGRILSPIVDPMKKAQKLTFLKFLNQRDFKSAFEILLKAHKKGLGLISASQRFGISQSEALEIAQKIDNCFVSQKSLVVYSKEATKLLRDIICKILDKNPNALLSAALLTQKQSWVANDFAQHILDSLLQEGILCKNDSFYVGVDSKIGKVQDYLYDKIYSILQQQGFEPMAPYNLYDMLDIDRKSGDDIYKKLTKEKKIVRLSHKLFVCTQALTQILNEMRNIIKKEGYLDLNNFKEHFNLSRKYLISYLDYLDSFSDIENTGGKRIIKSC